MDQKFEDNTVDSKLSKKNESLNQDHITVIPQLDLRLFIKTLKQVSGKYRMRLLGLMLKKMDDSLLVAYANREGLLYICHETAIPPITFLENLREIHSDLNPGMLFSDAEDFFRPLTLFIETQNWKKYFSLFKFDESVLTSQFMRIGFETLTKKEQRTELYKLFNDLKILNAECFKNQGEDLIRIYRTLPVKEQGMFLKKVSPDEQAIETAYNRMTEMTEFSLFINRLGNPEKITWTKPELVSKCLNYFSEQKTLSVVKQLSETGVLDSIELNSIENAVSLIKLIKLLSETKQSYFMEKRKNTLFSLLKNAGNVCLFLEVLETEMQLCCWVQKLVDSGVLESIELDSLDHTLDLIQLLPENEQSCFIEKRKDALFSLLKEAGKICSFLNALEIKIRVCWASKLFDAGVLDSIELNSIRGTVSLIKLLPEKVQSCFIEKRKDALFSLLKNANGVCLFLEALEKEAQICWASKLFDADVLDSIELNSISDTVSLIKLLPEKMQSCFIEKRKKDLLWLLKDDSNVNNFLLESKKIRDYLTEKLSQLTDGNQNQLKTPLIGQNIQGLFYQEEKREDMSVNNQDSSCSNLN